MNDMCNVDIIQRVLADIDSSPGNTIGVGGSLERTEHPYLPRETLEIATVIEYRFSFYYWYKWSNEIKKLFSGDLPDIITLDCHDDTGSECDYPDNCLDTFPMSSEAHVSFFCWHGMRKNNDGNAWPAMHYNLINDVHVIMPKISNRDHAFSFSCDRQHHVNYYTTPDEYIKRNRCDDRPVILDIDIDYFMTGPLDKIKKNFKRVNQLFENSDSLWNSIKPRLYAISIAIEPNYCGGTYNAFMMYNYLLSMMFPSKSNRAFRKHIDMTYRTDRKRNNIHKDAYIS